MWLVLVLLSSLVLVYGQSAALNSTSAAPVTLYIPKTCVSQLNYLVLVFQSIGFNTAELCASDGDFAAGLSRVSSCASANIIGATTIATLVDPQIVTAQSFCQNEIPVQIDAKSSYSESICCGSDAGAKIFVGCGTTTINPSICAAYITSQSVTNSTTIANPAISSTSVPSSGPSPASTTTSGPMSSSAATSETSAASSGTNIGLIVGASVGATLGVILLASVLGFWLYRRRKHKKERSAVVADQPEEKAQLHSEDIKPKEMPGAPLVLVRSVGGLEEMDGSQSSNVKNHIRSSELPVHEPVGHEMDVHGNYVTRSDIDTSEQGTSGYSGSTRVMSQR